MGSTTRSIRIRGDFDEIARMATDPDVVFPIMGGFGRFDRIDRYSDGSQEWDLYLDVGSIHVGGRVAVDAPGAGSLTWRSIRGTHHSARLEVSPDDGGAVVSMTVTVELAGRLVVGWVAQFLADGILGRHIEAGLQQLRHRIEYGS